jgi:hypothetical protein
VLNERAYDLINHSIDQSINQTINQSNNSVVDFDWAINQIVGSTTLSNHQAPLISLTLTTSKSANQSIDQSVSQSVNQTVEMSLPQLDALIKSLEAATQCINMA